MQKRVHYTPQQLVTWLKNTFPDVNWDTVEEQLPPVIWRSRWDILAEKLGLPYSRKYIQNLDCMGKGPGNIKA
jgi:hypothetical protein